MQDLPLSGFADDSLTSAARTAQTVTFTSKKDNDAAAAIALTPNATTGAWDYTQTANGDHSDDGLYVYTLTVDDIAGKTTTATKTVRIDTTAPEITSNEPWSRRIFLNINSDPSRFSSRFRCRRRWNQPRI